MKESNNDSDFEVPQNGKYRSDVRGMVLAHIFKNKINDLEMENALNGKFQLINRKTELIQYMLIIVLFLLFFLHKPEWCASRGDMLPDCTADRRGIKYKLLNTYFFPETLDFIITLGCMLPLTIIQYFRHKNIPQFKIERVKFILIFSVLVITFTLKVLISYRIIPRTDIVNSMKIFFCLLLSTHVLKTFIRMFNLLKFVGFVLTLLGVNTFMFALIFRIIFKNMEVNESQNMLLPPYSFISLSRSIETLVATIFLETLPSIVSDFFKVSKLAFVLLILYIFITNIILMSLLCAIFYNIYQNYYIANYDKINYYYPNFEDVIKPIMEDKFMDKGKIERFLKTIALNKQYMNEMVSTDKRPYLTKIKRAVLKIKIIKILTDQLKYRGNEDAYFEFRALFLFKLADYLLSFYLIFLPGIVINNANQVGGIDYILTSELVAFVFLLDIFMIYKSTNNKQDFYTFYNTGELLINIGIIVSANLYFLRKIDVFHYDETGEYVLFVTWGIFCIAKLLRVHAQLFSFINYRVIINTFLDIIPLIIDLVIIYAVFNLVYSTLAVSFYGGLYTNEFSTFMKDYKGSDEEDTKLGFNDIVLAFLTFLSSDMTGINDTTVSTMGAVMHYTKNYTYVFLTKLFFMSYLVFNNLIIINIIVGIVVDFLSIYLQNVVDIKEKENKIADSKGLYDILLDKEFKEELDKEENYKQKHKLVNSCERVILMTDEELKLLKARLDEKIKKNLDE